MPVNVERLQGYNNTLLKRVATLEEQNALLKLTLLESIKIGLPVELPPNLDLSIPEEQQESWADKSEHFDMIREKLFRVAYDVIRKTGHAVHQDEILRAFRSRHSTLAGKTGPETGPRRLREMAVLGWLSKPKEAYYYFGSSVVNHKQEEAKAVA